MGNTASTNYKVSFSRSYRAELYRLTTTKFTIITSVVLVILFSALMALAAFQSNIPMPFAGVTFLWKLPSLLLLIIGIGAVTSEYSQNTMRTSILADPRRGRIFSVKLLALLSYSALVAILLLAIGAALLALSGNTTDNLDSNTLIIYLRTILMLLGSAALGLGIGYTLRSTAGSITLGFVITELLGLITLIPKPFFQETLPPFIFGTLGNNVTSSLTILGLENHFDPWQALGIFWIYPLIFLVLGVLRFTRTDI